MPNVKRNSPITPEQIIEARGTLTQRQAADLLSVSIRQWRNYETGVTAMRERDFHSLLVLRRSA
jgi:hypothetical protein